MKQNIAIIILLAALIVLIVIAVFAYNNLSEQYSPDDFVPAETTVAEGSAATTEEKIMAPDFTVTDYSGNKVKLSDFFGKPIVINFWATWCGPCKSELPAFDKAYAEYGEEIEFLMVNLTDGVQDTEEKVRKFVSDGGYSFPVFFDTEYSAANAYGTYSIPVTVMINADGSVYDARIGAMNETTLFNLINGLLE
ncbi:MAG: TlpA family protein disulfide reductase [Clostridia bacterium]|nr:TlpA family protein disulfide reductase [Clostridia bacterium]